jgi:hypothetical protein
MSPFPAALLIVAFVMNVAHAEDSLGRLFLTPEQRHELDALRDPNAPPTAMGLAGALPAGTAADRTVVVNGVVRRSRGSDVVWVNGARAGAAPGQPVQLRRGPDKNNRVTLQDAEGAVGRLKPGQFWDPATGRVANCFGCTAPHKTTDLVAPLEQAPVPTPAAMPPANAPPTTPP